MPHEEYVLITIKSMFIAHKTSIEASFVPEPLNDSCSLYCLSFITLNTVGLLFEFLIMKMAEGCESLEDV